MKCPKCGYLGFERVERCRNCGYDFSLAPPSNTPDLAIRPAQAPSESLDDLALIDSAAASRLAAAPGHAGSGDTPVANVDIARPADPSPAPTAIDEFRLFADALGDEPLITRASPPRPPLAVRRATPEVPRLRAAPPRAPMLDLAAGDEPHELAPTITPAARARSTEWTESGAVHSGENASMGERIAATLIDVSVLAAIDAAVVYFTLQICGLTLATASGLPLAPLAAFLLMQNSGYLVAFTTGGQTLGKMVAGIKVVNMRGASVDLGRAAVRSAIWLALAAPAGLGFLTAFLNREHRGLHDQLAGTRVVRAASA